MLIRGFDHVRSTTNENGTNIHVFLSIYLICPSRLRIQTFVHTREEDEEEGEKRR